MICFQIQVLGLLFRLYVCSCISDAHLLGSDVYDLFLLDSESIFIFLILVISPQSSSADYISLLYSDLFLELQSSLWILDTDTHCCLLLLFLIFLTLFWYFDFSDLISLFDFSDLDFRYSLLSSTSWNFLCYVYRTVAVLFQEIPVGAEVEIKKTYTVAGAVEMPVGTVDVT